MPKGENSQEPEGETAFGDNLETSVQTEAEGASARARISQAKGQI